MIIKRALALSLVFVVLVVAMCPAAYAMEIINGYGSSMSVAAKGLNTRSLNDDSDGRTLAINGDIEFGRYSTSYTTVSDTSFSFSETSQFVIDTVETTSTKYGIHLATESLTIDYTASVYYAADAYQEIVFNGGGNFSLAVVRVGDDQTIERTPASVSLLVNGSVYGDSVNYNNGVTFTAVSLPLDEDITSIGFRFTFSDASRSVTGAGSGDIQLVFNIDDTSVYTVTLAPEDPPYLAPMGTMIGQLNNIESSINNVASDTVSGVSSYLDSVFNDPVMDSAAAENQTAIDAQITESESIQADLDTLDKPEVSEISPDLSAVSPVEDFTAFTDTFSAITNNNLISTLLLLSCTFAFLSYVLFGKRG